MKQGTAGWIVITLVLVAGLLAGSAQGATLYWDGATPAGAPTGGAGTWDTAGNWDITQSADSSSNWTSGDTAYFGGTAGTVTLGTDITVGGLRFDTHNYTINTDANTLSFGTGDNNILLNGNNTANVTATITGAVGGTGNVIFSFGAIQAWALFQNLQGQGVITLNGTSTTGWSGTTTVNHHRLERHHHRQAGHDLVARRLQQRFGQHHRHHPPRRHP